MQADLHYYITFVSALAAGFPPSEATDIAMAAHYVDCSGDPGPIPSPFGEGNLQPTIGPVRMLYAAASALSDTQNRDIWACFHFLPSNNRLVTARYQYAWDNMDRPRPADATPAAVLAPPPAPALAEHRRMNADTEVRLLADLPNEQRTLLSWRCFPYSATVDAMRQDMMSRLRMIQARRQDLRQYGLSLLGVRLHVLADTFSHAGCSAPKSRANLYASIAIKTARPEARAHFLPGQQQVLPGGGVEGWVPLNFVTAARAPVAAVAIGHAYYGALPDFPGLSWRTEGAGFDGMTIYRNNPVCYTNAIAEIRRWLDAAYQELGRPQYGASQATIRTRAAKLLGQLDFSSGVFEYPGDSLNLCARNRDLFVRNSQRYHEMKGQTESDLYLEKRLDYVWSQILRAFFKLPVRVEPPHIHGKEDQQLKQAEEAYELGEALAGWSINTSKPSWEDSDKGTEYRIIRRVRVEYFKQRGYAKLRDVNKAATDHLHWFQDHIRDTL